MLIHVDLVLWNWLSSSSMQKGLRAPETHLKVRQRKEIKQARIKADWCDNALRCESKHLNKDVINCNREICCEQIILISIVKTRTLFGILAF